MEIAAGDVVVLPRGWDGHCECCFCMHNEQTNHLVNHELTSGTTHALFSICDLRLYGMANMQGRLLKRFVSALQYNSARFSLSTYRLVRLAQLSSDEQIRKLYVVK